MGNATKRSFLFRRLAPSLTYGLLVVVALVFVLRGATYRALASSAGVPPPQVAPQAGVTSASDWRTTTRDSYDGTFASTYAVPRVISAIGSAPYQWGRVVTGSASLIDTLWSVQGGQGISLTAGVDTYTDDVTTTVTYGPISMRNVVTAELQFSHWISVADGDGLEWGYSSDGSSFTFAQVPTVTMGEWHTTTLNSDTSEALAGLLGGNKAYVAFRFHSNVDGQVGLGAFLDDVRFRNTYHTTMYMPMTYRPQSAYVDDFSVVTSGWPREWERKCCGNNYRGGYLLDRPALLSELLDRRGEPFQQVIMEDGSQVFYGQAPDGTLRPLAVSPAQPEREVYYAVIHDAWDEAFISGPFQTLSGDFYYEAKGRIDYVQDWFPGNRYGLLISKEKVNPSDPHSIHGYSFYVEINPRSDGSGYHTPGWAVQRWSRDNWQGGSDSVAGPHTSSDIHSSLGTWNTLRIERVGSTIRAYVNGVLLAEKQDDTYTGPMYVGFFARHTGSGSTELSYDVLINWDDVAVDRYP